MDEHRMGNDGKGKSGVRWLVRFCWMVVGTVILAFSAAFIVRHDSLGVADGTFWLAVLLMAATRFVDILYLGGETVEGRAATPRDLCRYLILMPFVTALIWLCAHAVARFGWLM